MAARLTRPRLVLVLAVLAFVGGFVGRALGAPNLGVGDRVLLGLPSSAIGFVLGLTFARTREKKSSLRGEASSRPTL